MEGNPGKRALPENEPQPPAGVPDKPESIAGDEVASKEWERICSLTVLKMARVLTVQDGPILEATCSAYSLWRDARDFISKNGVTYETTTSDGSLKRVPNPEVSVEKDAWRRYVSGLTHFGLSPATRGKVERLSDGEQEGSAAAVFD